MSKGCVRFANGDIILVKGRVGATCMSKLSISFLSIDQNHDYGHDLNTV